MLLLTSDSLKGYGLNRVFAFVKDAGYDGLELALSATDADTQNPEYIKSLVSDYGIPVRAVRTFPNSTIKKSMVAFDIARKVGASMVILEPPKLFDFKYVNWLKKDVASLRKKYGIKIALKNTTSETFLGFLPGRAMNNIGDLKRFQEVCLDTANLYSKKIDLIRAYDALKGSVVSIHLSNVMKGQIHCPPQEGVMPLESLLTKLKKDKYQGDISIIVQPKKLHAGHDKKVLKELKDIKSFHDKYFA